jgi:hypothetical protein
MGWKILVVFRLRHLHDLILLHDLVLRHRGKLILPYFTLHLGIPSAFSCLLNLKELESVISGVFRAVEINGMIWDVTSSSLVDSYRRLWGRCCLYSGGCNVLNVLGNFLEHLKGTLGVDKRK